MKLSYHEEDKPDDPTLYSKAVYWIYRSLTDKEQELSW